MAIPHFEAEYAPSDMTLVRAMLARNAVDPAFKKRVQDRALTYVEAIRDAPKGAGLEDFMQEYSLTTKEGLALMVLAEALLRIPDEETQDKLIADKLGEGDWDSPDGDEGWLLMAASWGIGLSARIVRPGETPGGVIRNLVRRVGSPAVRIGTRQAMNFLGRNFVLGETIEAAMERAKRQEKKGYRYSYDMLGEGARTMEDAKHYYDSYAHAIDAIGSRAKSNQPPEDRPGISVKLSALDPRYFLKNRDEVMDNLVARTLELAKKAKAEDLNFTMDAEEADRLEISLEIFRKLAMAEELKGWDGLGLAVQAYQKRAPEVIHYIDDLAKATNRRFMLRLVKGAYWDTEIKRAQERGLDDFPVFTRKPATDLCYLDCARTLLDCRPRIFPQFATHNALTMSAIIEMGGKEGFEFQRLHGMGEVLYDAEVVDSGIPVRIYAPVGGYKDLLAYLVRRMLENAANSSFVAQIADDRIPNEDLLEFPQEELRPDIENGEPPVHPLIRTPERIYPLRRNSKGLELGHQPHIDVLRGEMDRFRGPREPLNAIINGVDHRFVGETQPILNPSRLDQPVGEWRASGKAEVDAAMAAAKAAFPDWNARPVAERADILRHFADLMEEQMPHLIAVIAHEAGRTIDDGIAEVREAVDFCRYYANRAEELMVTQELPGPVGESNMYHLEGRGVWGAISPWNFPLAIFVGQVVAALVTGNTVVAKPAPQTPYIAWRAVELMLEAGVPSGAISLVLGAGETGAALVGHKDISGVVFTGSVPTAKAINRTLAEKDGPIVPLIAETGGINAMVVDSSALPEQVTDAVIASAFRSAGQRCSALRLLYVQDDVADDMIKMIKGAAEALAIGAPMDFGMDVGPLIDKDACERLETHWKEITQHGKVVYEGKSPVGGTFFAPRIVELDAPDRLQAEAFGPILHICRWKSKDLDKVMAAARGTGFGLTFGIHSRIEGQKQALAEMAPAGNVYINRNQVGAIVGVQPFGGHGLSGTGPKAGGPLYLTRFVEEKHVCEDTTAAGGNASLIALSDE
ncbi:bifunctional proline dehydrogenase/L-glutamate gamma-semialdehyde dehydrogenase PutA [Parvularcula marina]|uniref:Bifunctional protein PutA n=1 Tax=Parvularcula marina TaxID=2292771 RepID=A0A371RJ84_9PROT|nr:bifunctional proline dehydrogenase/L-glutamate gamma-semialdehyde dehydrogenase PutA [Parvularcula marina]RFB05496.1 bifunctional proline dehydrogenase/L-glutamate gamma-semialdehyde dehydrogenase PutA [Parvularcula marina]